MPLHELDLLFGTLQDHVHPHLMSMSLRFHIDPHVVHQLEDAGLHSGAHGLDVVLLSHLVALGHELLHKCVDLVRINEILLIAPAGVGGDGGVHGSSSGKGLALYQVVDVLIEVSPGWVTDEGNLTLLVD